MKQKILIVDQNQSIRELYTECLKERGHDVVAFDNGSCAMEALSAKSSNFDALITEYQLPKLSGMELISKSESMGISPKNVLLVSSLIGVDDVVLNFLKKHTAVKAIEKPFIISDVLKFFP